MVLKRRKSLIDEVKRKCQPQSRYEEKIEFVENKIENDLMWFNPKKDSAAHTQIMAKVRQIERRRARAVRSKNSSSLMHASQLKEMDSAKKMRNH